MEFVPGWGEWIILALTVLGLLYLYATRNRNYWKNQQVPYEPLSLIFGPGIKLLTRPLHVLDSERYKKYGRFFGTFEAGKMILYVAEPEVVKQVLVKDFPVLPNRRQIKFYDPLLDNMMSISPVERWRKLRPAASPAFSTGKLRKMNSLIEDCAVITAEHLKEAASNEEDIDIKQFFGNYTLDVIARCAFATRLDSHSDQTNEFVTTSRQTFTGRLTARLLVTALFPTIAKIIKLKPVNSEPFQYFKQICQNIIQSRHDQQTRNEDFLQLMMDAKEGKLQSVNENISERENQLFNLGSEVKTDTTFSSDKTLTEDEAMSQCLLFLLAGQETTSTAITFTLYLLAINPEVQEKLREEVDECFRIHGDHPSLDVVTKLKYLHCVVSESLRMYPPATRVDRSPIDDYVLAGKGVTVKKGELIIIPVYAMHYDPEYFPNPYIFDPERFSDENLSSIEPYTYLPFGAGPRNCIGMRFALQTLKLAVLYTLRHVKLVRTKNTKVPLDVRNDFTILIAKDAILGIRKRD